MKLLRRTSVAAERDWKTRCSSEGVIGPLIVVRTGGARRRTEVGGFLDGAHDNSFSL